MGRSLKRSGRRGQGSYRKRQQARALSCSTTISYVGAKTLVSSLPAPDDDVISKLEDLLNRREAFEGAAVLRDTAKSGALLVQRPFASLLVSGVKTLELRSKPPAANWAGKRVMIMQSKTASSLECCPLGF